MNKNPLVSVIIPLYNCEDRIIRCVNSVLNQTYKNIEVIVIDDGSTDNSLEVIRNGISDPRLKIYTQENHGVSYTRNRGIDIALSNDTEGWIAFVDSDDYIDINAINECFESIDFDSIDLIHFGRKFVRKNKTNNDCNGVRTLVDQKEALALMMNGLLSSKACNGNWLYFATAGIYKKSIIRETGFRFNESLDLGEDAFFVLEYLTMCTNIFLVNLPLYIWVDKDNSLSHLKGNNYIARFLKEWQSLWPMMLDLILKYNDCLLNNIFAKWNISYFNNFLNKSAKLNLNYTDVKRFLKKILSQDEMLQFVYCQKIQALHEKIARLMLKSRSAFVSYVVIKAIRLVNGYWRVK